MSETVVQPIAKRLKKDKVAKAELKRRAYELTEQIMERARIEVREVTDE